MRTNQQKSKSANGENVNHHFETSNVLRAKPEVTQFKHHELFGALKAISFASTLVCTLIAAPVMAEEDLSGEEVFDNYCAECHTDPTSGAPLITDREEWEARLEKGMGTLLMHAEEGFQGERGVMPPMGGFEFLTKEDLKRAVEHMGRYPQFNKRPPISRNY